MKREHQEYIADILRHASYKKYENYVLSRIYWNLVDVHKIELELKTQQTVLIKGTEHHVVYMDGYFPALNVQIEVDEPHHKHQLKEDASRESAIMKELGVLDAIPQVFRIDITKDIDKQIADTVNAIVKIYHKCNDPKWVDCFEHIKRQKCIKYRDNIIFPKGKKFELLNSIGLHTKKGKPYPLHGTQGVSTAQYSEDTDVWFPAIKDNPASGWHNTYDIASGVFETQRIGSHINVKSKGWKNAETAFKNGNYRDRYVIFLVANSFNKLGYKYYGKFKCIYCNAKERTERWQRISTEDLKCIDPNEEKLKHDMLDELLKTHTIEEIRNAIQSIKSASHKIV